MKVFLFAFFILFTLSPLTVFACRCRPLPLEHYYQQADSVFLAKITEQKLADENENVFAYTLVGSVMKGSSDQNSIISTAAHSATCGIQFEIGKTYLVFANSQEAVLHTNSCSGTRYFNPDEQDASEDFVDVKSAQILKSLHNLHLREMIINKGIGGTPLADSIIGILDFSGLKTGELHSFPVTLHTSPDEKTATEVVHFSELEQLEFSYEESGVVVFEELNGFWKVKSIKGKYLWLQGNVQNHTFHPLNTLLVNRLSYLTQQWNGLLWSAPGAGLPSMITPEEELPVQVEKSAQIADSLWFYVRIYKHHPCEGSNDNVEQFSYAGWVPAWNAQGEVTTWFWSRGC